MAYLPPTTFLETGSKDTAAVKQLQDYLVENKYLTEAQKATGYGTYGPQTTAAVAALQKNLGVDNSTGVGQFGPRTIAAINGASGTQGNAIADSLKSGNVNQYGIPNNIGDILGVKNGTPSPTSPIDASKLSGSMNTKSLNDILSSALSDPNPTSSIAGLLSLYGASTDAQKEVDKQNAEMLALTRSLGNEDKDLQAELEKQGVPGAYQQVKELNLKGAQLKGELDAYDVETEKGIAAIEDQPVTARVVAGQQAKLQKQRSLEKMAKAAELSAVVGLAQAYQGNAELGAQLAEQSVKLKYTPIRNAIQVLKEQINIAGNSADKADARNSKIIGGLISLKENQIDKAEANDKQIQALAIQAATNGAPAAVIRAIQASPDPVSAASAGSSFIKGNLESVTGSGTGADKTFSPTQQNKGAQVAGLDLAGFNGLDYEVKNYFVNNTGADEFIAAVNGIKNGTESLQDILSELDSSGLPAPVVAYLKQKAQAAAPADGSGGGGILGTVGGWFSSGWNGVKSILGL